MPRSLEALRVKLIIIINMKTNNRKDERSGMKKIFEGIVVSIKMKKTAIVRITRKFPHPLYKKLIKRDAQFSVDVANFALKIGNKVKIVEVKPISKTKHFKVLEVIKDGSA
jgi:small subunit ribosomal protein S17